MKRVQQGVQFHHKDHLLNNSKHTMNTMPHHYNSHELDAKAMKVILTELFAKTLDTKKKQKENPHHHYEGIFVETDNIDKPPIQSSSHTDTQEARNEQMENKLIKTFEEVLRRQSVASTTADDRGELIKKHGKFMHRYVVARNETSEKETKKTTIESKEPTSGEVFRDVLDKINSLGYRGKKILKKLMDEIEKKGPEGEALRQAVNKTMNDHTLSNAEKRRRRRDLVLSSPLHKELTEEDEDDDAAVEEVKQFMYRYVFRNLFEYIVFY